METTLTSAPRTAPVVIDLGKVLGMAKTQPVPAMHALVALGNSIRRSAAVVTELGATLPEVSAESPRHFYSADAPAGTIARCGADLSERVTRHGREVTCDMCKAIHRAELDATEELLHAAGEPVAS
jgi:hypothetical protein